MLEFLEQRDSFPSWNLLDCTVWVCKKEDRLSFVIPGRALDFRGEGGEKKVEELEDKDQLGETERSQMVETV